MMAGGGGGGSGRGRGEQWLIRMPGRTGTCFPPGSVTTPGKVLTDRGDTSSVRFACRTAAIKNSGQFGLCSHRASASFGVPKIHVTLKTKTIRGRTFTEHSAFV